MKIYIKRLGAIFAVCMSFHSGIYCQSTGEIEDSIAKEFEAVQSGSIKANDYRFSPSNEKRVLLFLRKYDNATSSDVRFRARSIKAKIALQTSDPLIKKEIAEDFIADFSGSDQAIIQQNITRLLTFHSSDFSDNAKRGIVKNFAKLKSEHNFILLCGLAGISSLKEQLTKMAAEFDRNQEGWFSSDAWYASIALVRLGDSRKIDTLIAAVELESEPVIRVTRLLGHLAFTKHPDALKLLGKYLESSERLPGMDGRIGTSVNQYALEFLAENFDNSPIKPRGIGYSAAEVEQARQFLKTILKNTVQ